MKTFATLLAMAAAAVCAQAQADTLTVAGTTEGAPTFNRPQVVFSALSAVGTAVSYNVLELIVDTTAEYSFVTTAGFDSFTFLYSPSFDPVSPLVNGLEANDDLNGVEDSGFTTTLLAGTPYSYVVTGFANTDFGAFNISVSGPGVITAVPEPGTYMTLLAGLAAMGGLVRRRASASAV